MLTSCPFCNAEFEVDASYENEETKCPSCENDFIITRKEETVPVQKPIRKETKAIGGNLRECPDCKRAVSAKASVCPCCGHAFLDSCVATWLIVLLWICGLLLPFGMVIVVILTSILYYAWKNIAPKKASRINKCGWTIFLVALLVQALFVGAGTFLQSSFSESSLISRFFIPKNFKNKAMDFMEKGTELGSLSDSGINYITLKNKVPELQSSYNFLLVLYPDFKKYSAHKDFIKSLHGYSLALRLWNAKMNKLDNPVEPDVNGYLEYLEYMQGKEFQEIHSGDMIVTQYRGKKYLPFDENISLLLTMAYQDYKAGETKLLKLVK